MSDQLPEDVRRFIIEHINSVEQLEVLLLLRRHADQDWDAERVSQSLYTSSQAAAMRLADLATQGFLTGAESRLQYRYRSSGTELEPLIDSLAELYRERRVSVISLIYSKPHTQVQAFADSFRLRKDK